MDKAELEILFAGPLTSLQDRGRPKNMRFGVPASGPMDRLAFEAGNAAVGNENLGQTAIEVSLGGLILLCKDGAVTIAVTGGDFQIDHASQKHTAWSVITIRKGERLHIRAGQVGSWAYLAFAGCIETTDWLGSASTHTTSGFGGSLLQSGQSLVVHGSQVRDEREGDISMPDFEFDGEISVVLGPQDHLFSSNSVESFLANKFEVSAAYDRMGMRLVGPPVQLEGALSIPSEPIVRGSVQVAGDGVASILLADHQTAGGYPKIATLISCETDRVAQFRSGQEFGFRLMNRDEALKAVKKQYQKKQKYLEKIKISRGTLEQRLMRENLIHGLLPDDIY